MKKRIVSILLAVVMIVGMIPLGVITAYAESGRTYIKREWNGSAVTETELDIPTDATEITGSTSTIGDGKWYVVSNNVTVSSRITVNGTANLILMDGYTLTADKGIELKEGNNLNIYGQSGNSGTVSATGDTGYAGIGGSKMTLHSNGNGGNVTVHGGTVSAQGGNSAAGIGGGAKGGTGGTVTVWGGTVSAQGGFGAAGIGGGSEGGTGGTVTIYGGTVSAQGGNSAAGIGGGHTGNGGNVYIHGGTVTAISSDNVAEGIGHGGGAQNSGNREIDASAVIKAGPNEGGAGEVDAYTGQPYAQIHFHNYIDWVCNSCSEHAKYIERKWDGSKVTETELDIPTDATEITGSTSTIGDGKWYVVSNNVTVSSRITVSGTANLILMDGYTLTAEGSILLVEGNALNVYGQKLNTGTLDATASYSNTGIGNHYKNGGTLTVHGGTVNAKGSNGCAGIGGGENSTGGTVTVLGGTVSATGNMGGAGIGGNSSGSGGDVTVYGGTVTAIGGMNGAGIGSGRNGSKGGTVTVWGGTVTATGGGAAAGIGGGAFGNGGDVYIHGGTVTAVAGDNNAEGIGHGSGAQNSGNREIDASAVIKAGDNSGAGEVINYAGQPYVNIHWHNFIDGVCTVCEAEEHPQGSLGKYIKREWNESTKTVDETEKDIPLGATVITKDTTELPNGWYAVTQNTNLSNDTPLLIKGDNVNIVLFDGCTLYSTSEIIIEDGAVINVYGQADDSGEFIISGDINGIQNNGTLNVYGGNISPCGYAISSAGIGGNGDVYIYGGSVDAQSYGNRAGICADNVYVYGGSVKAQGCVNGAGIYATGVYVYGGKTEAYGNSGGAGIGGSNGQDGGDFYFYGGVVEAYSIDYGGVGIGAGDGGSNHGAFEIDDKSVTTILAGADALESVAFTADEYREQRCRFVKIVFCTNHIDTDGDGWCDNCSAFFVEHYTVLKSDTTTLTGNILVESILAFNTPLVVSGDVTIYLATNAQITAYNGIVLNAGNSLTINAQVSDLCYVSAMGEYGAAGIGGKYGKSAGKLTVNGGIIRAYGGYGVKGIGGGMHGKDGEFTQNGGKVYSYNGGGVEHIHTFADTYSHNDTHHWRVCTCGHKTVDEFEEHTFGEGVVDGNKTTYTCKCGYTKVVYDKPDDEGEIISGTTYTGISLTLGSDISINFYMDLTEEAREKGTMTFNIGGRIVTLKGTDAKYNSTEEKYYFSTPLNVLEMAETVTATFTYNGINYVQQYSVAEYIDTIVGNPDKYVDEAVALARKIANYGHYVQLYLASIHSSVHIVDANSGEDGYLEMEKFDKTFDINVAAARAALANYTVTVSGTSGNISLYGTTVYFDAATALNYYVTVKNDVELTATAVNTKTGIAKEVEIKLYKDNIYIVSVKDITATELADDITVTINGEITLTGSVFAYCNSVVKAHSFDGATDNDTFAVNAMAAFYEYYKAAVDYAKTQG